MQTIRAPFLFLCTLIFCLWTASSFASEATPLPADQAFVLSVKKVSAQQVDAQWQIAPGYYLYAKRIHINLKPADAGDVQYPQGEFKFNAELGRYEVFKNSLTVPIILKSAMPSITMQIDYQGCSEEGFCYPPIHKSINLSLTDNSATVTNNVIPTASASSSFNLLTDQNSIRAVLDRDNLAFVLLIFIGIGLLLAFTPCVLPMIPILTSIIVGQKQAVTTRRAFLLSATYVLGSAVTYALAGVAAVFMGSSLQVWLQQPWVIFGVSMIFLLLAMSLFNFFHLRLPNRLHHLLHGLSHRQKGGTFAGVFMMGLISTLIVSPCVTAPLVGVLIYIAQTGDYLLGASALFAMGLGMGVPLLLLGLSAGRWLPKRGPWMEAVKKTFGLLMLAMAVWMLSRIASPTITSILWATVFIAVVAFIVICIAHIMKLHNKWHNKWIYSLGMTSGVLALIFVINVVPMAWRQPIQVTTGNEFIIVQNVQQLNKQLLIAQGLKKPVLVDFYADWCESCVAMDKQVFNLPTVRAALSKFILVRADLTANTTEDEKLLRQYSVVAPPTVLFFTNNGQEVNSRRIVGELSAQEFLNKLNTFFTASCDKTVQC